ISEDNAEAAAWFRKAAEQGHATAQFVLGLVYANGQGVPKNDTEAARWYRMAAEQGHATAQFVLGLMYAKGEGVRGDDVKAYAWLSIAAAQGLENAKKGKELLAGLMTNAQIAKAQKLSRKYREASGPER
ncbi:MAG: tetratricopeptide repeat protein, partial [Halieaceae bacterium]|nr:tetratricopeptide repeat protein [Halieaceae bacterium]